MIRDYFSAHPVSPEAIQFGMDETLWSLYTHRTLEESIHDYHQGEYLATANDTRRQLAALGHEQG